MVLRIKPHSSNFYMIAENWNVSNEQKKIIAFDHFLWHSIDFVPVKERLGFGTVQIQVVHIEILYLTDKLEICAINVGMKLKTSLCMIAVHGKSGHWQHLKAQQVRLVGLLMDR